MNDQNLKTLFLKVLKKYFQIPKLYKEKMITDKATIKIEIEDWREAS